MNGTEIKERIAELKAEQMGIGRESGRAAFYDTPEFRKFRDELKKIMKVEEARLLLGESKNTNLTLGELKGMRRYESAIDSLIDGNEERAEWITGEIAGLEEQSRLFEQL